MKKCPLNYSTQAWIRNAIKRTGSTDRRVLFDNICEELEDRDYQGDITTKELMAAIDIYLIYTHIPHESEDMSLAYI